MDQPPSGQLPDPASARSVVLRGGLERSGSAAEERALVDAILQRDRKATGEFVALHADAVYRYIRSRLFPRMDLAEDLVQETFLAAWQNLAGFRGDAPLRQWVLGIARHKVEDYYRARLREAIAPDEEDAGEEPPRETESLDVEIDRDRARRKIREVLAELPESYRVALLWRYWEQGSAREIAQATAKTEKAVERLLARAREQFRKRWTDER